MSLTICLIMFTLASIAQPSWQYESIRQEIDPVHSISDSELFNGNPTMMLSGGNKEYVNGSWSASFPVEPDSYYQFVTHFKASNVEEMDRSVLASLTWFSAEGKRVEFIEYPGLRANQEQNGWNKIMQVYQVPQGAVRAKVNLIYRWDADGRVFFGETTLNKTEPPKPRLVKVGAIHYRPMNTASAEENLQQFETYIRQAGEKDADIICLPEGITTVGNGQTYLEASEPVPGPTTRFLGKLAREYDMYIVAGILEKEGPVLYNTSVLLGRDGQLAGKYRKVSLPREEIDGGITPGNDFPVFKTDFGTIGMMICWDVTFPEPARVLALKGAEIILMPIWGGNITLSKARAIENQVYLVSSTYDMKTGIFDKTGDLLVEGTESDPVVVTEIDLNQRELWDWLGELRNRIRREMPDKESINY